VDDFAADRISLKMASRAPAFSQAHPRIGETLWLRVSREVWDVVGGRVDPVLAQVEFGVEIGTLSGTLEP